MGQIHSADKLHSKVMGGSSAERRLQCPGGYAIEELTRILKERGLIQFEEKTSSAALKGTVLHAAIEICLNDFDTYSEAMKEGFFAGIVGNDLSIKSDTGETYEITFEDVEKKLKPAALATYTVIEKYGLTEWECEVSLSLDSIIPGAFGTTDFVGVDSKGRVHVLDWKFGDGVIVPVEQNTALMFYAAGVIYDESAGIVAPEDCDPDMLEDFALAEPPEHVILHIIQPTERGKTLKSYETTMTAIDDFLDVAIEAVAKAKELTVKATKKIDIKSIDKIPTKPGDWCTFCPVIAFCPTYEKMGRALISTKPTGMDKHTIAKLLQGKSMITKYFAALEDYAQAEIEGGAAIPGLKVVEALGNMTWLDEDRAKALLSRREDKDNFFIAQEPKMLTAAQTKKVLGEEKFKEVFEDKEIAGRPKKGNTVVSDLDKREPVATTVSLMASVGKALSKTKKGKK